MQNLQNERTICFDKTKLKNNKLLQSLLYDPGINIIYIRNKY